MEERDKHFNKVFYFICCMCGLIMAYIFVATFMPLSQGAIRFVDTNMGYFQSALSMMIGYFIGASPKSSKDTTKTE